MRYELPKSSDVERQLREYLEIRQSDPTVADWSESDVRTGKPLVLVEVDPSVTDATNPWDVISPGAVGTLVPVVVDGNVRASFVLVREGRGYAITETSEPALEYEALARGQDFLLAHLGSMAETVCVMGMSGAVVGTDGRQSALVLCYRVPGGLLWEDTQVTVTSAQLWKPYTGEEAVSILVQLFGCEHG